MGDPINTIGWGLLPAVRVSNGHASRFNFDEWLFRTGVEVLRCLAESIVNFAPRWNSMLREHFPFVRDKTAQETLGNLRPGPALKGMENFEHREKRPASKEEREAKKQRARQEAEIALAARKKEDDAFRANFQRLKAERLAREAAAKS